MLPWIVTSPDSHCKSTAGYIAARLEWLLVVKDAESSITGFVALVQTFAPGPICQTAGVVIVNGRHQPLTQPLQSGRYH